MPSGIEEYLVPNRELAMTLGKPLPEKFGQHRLADRRLINAAIMLDVFSDAELSLALQHYARQDNKRTLETIFSAHNKVDYTTRFKMAALQQGINFVPLEQFRVVDSTVKLLNPEIARQHRIVPFYVQELDDDGNGRRIVWCVTGNPNNAAGKESIRKFFSAKTPPYDVEFLAAAPDLIEKMINSRYTQQAFDIDDAEEEEVVEDDDPDLGPAQEFFSRIFAKAVDLGASDVHVEGDFEGTGGIQVRMRIDGVLAIIERADKKYKDSIIAVMKLNFGMDVAERRKPQSGRASRRFEGRKIDFRAETLPTIDSEDIVVRLLDKGSLKLDLDEMGWTPHNLERFRKAYRKPYGAIIVTGPTGSGKTSTLYAVLKELTKETEKLITMEDPVEYQLAGLRQVHVDARAGRTFAATLKAILRCDPDIVMVGEIRDEETAANAMRAANTGHLVLSTLHTNEAAAGPIQLTQMGVPDYVVADALSVVVAQRLLRRLCKHCKQPYQPSEIELKSLMSGYEAEQVTQILTTIDSYQIFGPSHGCTECSKGYAGRLAIHEVLIVGDAEKEVILSPDRSALKLRKAVKHTLRQDAMYKALEGITSFDEVRRVTNDT